MIRSAISIAAAALLMVGGPAAAQDYAESGWRAATEEEKSLREAFEDAQDDWNSRRDGENERYDCILRWAIWSDTARRLDVDMIPAISGGLSHSYADAQMSHHLNTVLVAAGGDTGAVGQKLSLAAQRLADRLNQGPGESVETILEQLGKCYVQPLSWRISQRLTGPEMLDIIGYPDVYAGYPVWTKSRSARQQFDQHIMDKDFVAAANLGARLHGQNDKTTVMWNEVLRASLLSVEQGRGTELSDPLLSTLSQVWWPRHRRTWASNLLRQKRGLPPENSGRSSPPLNDPNREPGWVTQERERYFRGETNYVPCNRWNTIGC